MSTTKYDIIINELKKTTDDALIFLTREGGDFNVESILNIHLVGQGAFVFKSSGDVEVLCSKIDSHESQNSELVANVIEYEYGNFENEFAEYIHSNNFSTIYLPYSMTNNNLDSLYTGIYLNSFKHVKASYLDKIESAESILKLIY